MHPEPPQSNDRRAVFIDLPQTAHLGAADQFRRKAEAEGREYVRLEGDMRLIQGLIDARWNPEDYLVVNPGETIAGVYDWTEIVRSERR
jgi:hypothetical protein